jgi:hypothetical protein
MRWALTQSTNQFHYWKLEQHESFTELKYNKQAQSFRQIARDKRLFFIEKTGFLQHKFLLRTEYSVVAGEVFPLKKWRSGIIVFEGKKFQFLFRDGFLVVSSKKQEFYLEIEIPDSKGIDQQELYALLFGTLRVVVTETHKTNSKLVSA